MAALKTCFCRPGASWKSLYFNNTSVLNGDLINIRNVNLASVRHKKSTVLCPLPIPKHPPKQVPLSQQRKSVAESLLSADEAEMRFKYPEFLPDAFVEFRNKTCELLQRQDMIRRRTVLEIPEFYVGSILAVTISDPYAPGKISKFVGICIERTCQGTRHFFVLRNVVDHQGIEIKYDLYNPTIREIQVLRLEKRLDNHLNYLRDAFPEYSTFPLDMPAEPHPAGQPVPVNPIRVKMKPWPWSVRWETKDLKGMDSFGDVPDWLYLKSIRAKNQYEKYDLMKDYREHIPEDDQVEIWKDLIKHQKQVDEIRKVEKRKKLIAKSEISKK